MVYNRNILGTKSRKRQNKRSSWTITIDKSATLPKNLRFSSLVDLEENGTLRKKKNKKPSRSTSAIIGKVCTSLFYSPFIFLNLILSSPRYFAFNFSFLLSFSLSLAISLSLYLSYSANNLQKSR